MQLSTTSRRAPPPATGPWGGEARFIALVDQAVRLAGAIATLIGAFYFVTWQVGLAPRWSAAGAITMKTNMSVSLVLAGVALLLLEHGQVTPRRRLAGALAALLVFLVGLLTLSEHLLRVDLGIDQLLATEAPGAVATASPNRIGLPGSFSLALLGAGLLDAAWRRRVAPYLGLTTCFVVLVPTIGFVYGISPFYEGRVTGIAWPTIIGLFSIGVGLMLAERQAGPLAVLWRADPGGLLLRRLLLPAVLVPLVLGYLKVQGDRHGLYDGTTGTGLFSLLLVLLLSILLWRSAKQLSAAAAERQRAMEQLAATQERLAGIVEGTSDAIISEDLGGTILTWNAAAERLLGYRAEEAVGQSVEIIVPPDRRHEDKALLSRIKSGELVVHFETQRLTKFGGPVDVSMTLSPVRDHGGCVVGASRIVRDIAEQKRATEALRAASRLKDDFLSMASHELRTPLTTLRLQAETLARTLRRAEVADERVEHKLSLMNSQFDRMERLVHALLDVSRISAGKLVLELTEFDLAEVTREVVERFEALAETARSDIRLDAREVRGRWDRTRVDQVVTNILSNAIKYGKGQPINVAVGARDGAALLTVRDHGDGIPEESHARIFERFERAANTSGASGLGLGLWIASQMVKAHGGEIQLSSAPGAGATFTVVLPRSAP